MVEIPKQELLIKLLNMTTSSNDGEALAAIRKANELLQASAWSWEKLIHEKIRIIEDPFKNIPAPTCNESTSRGTTPNKPSKWQSYGMATPPKNTPPPQWRAKPYKVPKSRRKTRVDLTLNDLDL